MLRYRLRENKRAYFPRPDDMPPALHALLISRGIASAEEAAAFLNPSEAQLHDPFGLHDMDAAVARIRAAIERGGPICVYGDYDVDGVSASAILSMYLKSAGADVEVYLPSRHHEGYGLNEASIRALSERARLLITVDCGITSAALIALAQSLGMDAIVTDHHEPGETLPDCPVVNPLLNAYPCRSLCGAGVALKLVHALGGMDAARPYLDIAALATVADVVPLTGENRVLVALGLAQINAEPRLGLRALIQSAGLSDKRVTAGNIAFQLAPRLNAGGRIGSAKRSYDLLTATAPAEAQALADELELENSSRKTIEQQILAEAEAQLADFDFPAHRIIILCGDDWNTGVIGLTASRLVEKYHYPVILLSRQGDTLSGSCRSIPGVDIHAALTAAGETLLRYGGHKQAAGLTLSADRLDDFRSAMDAYLWASIPPVCYIPDFEYDVPVSLSDLTEAFVAQLDALQPTGFGNPAPVFRTSAQLLEGRRVGLEGAHLRTILSEGGVRKTGIFFHAGDLAGRLADTVDALFTPKLNSYMGRTEVQLELKSVRSGDVLSEISAKLRDETALQLYFLTEMIYNRGINPVCEAPREITLSALEDALSQSAQGTLILTASLAETGRLMNRFQDNPPDLFLGELPDDPQAFNAICCYAPPRIPKRYRRVVLAGMPPEIGPCEGAEVFKLPLADAWRGELPDIDQMRAAYKALLKLTKRPVHLSSFSELAYLLHTATGLSEPNCAASLLALHDMKLIQLKLDREPIELKLNAMQKTDPETSVVWRLLQRWRSERTETGG